MCLYTYHHFPACGHIANWTVTSCKEYTNTLRLLGHGGMSGYCNRIQTSHDLLSELESDTCGQCDFELQRAVSQQSHNGSQLKAYRTIEGLNSTVPIIELSVRLNVNTVDEEEDYSSPIPQEYRGCDCYSCTASSVSSGVSLSNRTPSSGNAADNSRYRNSCVYMPEISTQHGNQFEIMPRDLPNEEENTAELWKDLRRGSSSRDISPSSTQVDARKTRNSLHDALHTSVDRASHPLERLNTSNPYSWTSFDLSDESPIDVGSHYLYSNPINFSTSFYSDTEPEQPFLDLSDDSLYFGHESEVEDPNSLTFLVDDSDADDESDGGCDLPDKFDKEYVDMFSHVISPLVSSKANVSLPPVRDSAQVVGQPATPMLCPAPLRVKKPPRFLSLDSIIEILLGEETLEEDGLDILHDEYLSAYDDSRSSLGSSWLIF